MVYPQMKLWTQLEHSSSEQSQAKQLQMTPFSGSLLIRW